MSALVAFLAGLAGTASTAPVEVDELYKPVWISGEMRAQSRVQELSYVDGTADIETSYLMDALSVEVYE